MEVNDVMIINRIWGFKEGISEERTFKLEPRE